MSILRLILSLSAVLICAPAWAQNDLERSLQDGHAAGNLPGLHSVFVQRKDDILAEVYFEGADEVWGTPIGNRQHGPETLHDLRSVTKSIVGLLYGIALADGLVPPPSAPLLAQFPEYSDLSSPERDAITIEDVLTMRMGMAWDETLPYSDPRNSEIAMEYAEDRIRFVLEQKMVATPGEVFNYGGGATTLLAELIARGSGQPLDVFARKRLFEPLGIWRAEWVRGADGRPSAASGLRLSARGLTRIGVMVLQNGKVDDTQIVPTDWLEASLSAHVTADPLRFGYHWWLSPVGAPEWAAALGNGGQRMSIVKPIGLVGVIFAGNYNEPNAWEIPVSVITQYVAPTLETD
jgi:CubicO group peptidase (beta-lactamase class C family)